MLGRLHRLYGFLLVSLLSKLAGNPFLSLFVLKKVVFLHVFFFFFFFFLLMLLVFVFVVLAAGAAHEQLLLESSFDAPPSGNISAWRPFLSGFFRSSSQCPEGACLSLSPHNWFGAWQHVRVSLTAKTHLTLSARFSGEWAFALRASLSASLRFADGSRASFSLRLEPLGETGFLRACRTLEIDRPLAEATVFVVASPLSQSYGTLFVDDVELWAGDGSECAEKAEKKEGDDGGGDGDGEEGVSVRAAEEPSVWKKMGREGELCVVASVQSRDAEYVARLAELMRKNPVVVVVYASGKTAEEEFGRMSSVLAGEANARLVVASQARVEHEFPINVLRGTGQQHCPESATHALHLEAGMIPSSSVRVERLALSADEMIVLPAFEVVGGPNVQFDDKASLGKAESHAPLQIGRHILSYYSTRYDLWQTCSEDYTVRPTVEGALAEELGHGVLEPLPYDAMQTEPAIFNRHYAPVLIMPRSVTFDRRVLHHGHARASVLAEWVMTHPATGGALRVACQAFVTRQHEGETPLAIVEEVSSKTALRVWKTWYEFLGEKMAQHGFVDAGGLFRAMPFVSETTDHRLDRPFGTRLLIAAAAVTVSLMLLRALLKRERSSDKRRVGLVKQL